MTQKPTFTVWTVKDLHTIVSSIMLGIGIIVALFLTLLIALHVPYARLARIEETGLKFSRASAQKTWHNGETVRGLRILRSEECHNLYYFLHTKLL